MAGHKHTHQSHPDIIKRLRRAEGHLHSVIAMIVDERTCLDIAVQLHAVERAIENAKTELIRDHIDHCLETQSESGVRTLVDDLKAITKYL